MTRVEHEAASDAAAAKILSLDDEMGALWTTLGPLIDRYVLLSARREVVHERFMALLMEDTTDAG